MQRGASAGIPDESIHPDGEGNPCKQVVPPSKGDHQGQSLHLLQAVHHVQHGCLCSISLKSKDLSSTALAWLRDYPEGTRQASSIAAGYSRIIHTDNKYEHLMDELQSAEFRLKFDPADTLVCLAPLFTRML
jgi:hypothetical protein